MDAPTHFSTAAEFRQWLEQNHESATELWVAFHKTHTGTASITWPQSVDEALCFGWIDALRKSLGNDRYMIRFTRRSKSSTWSAVNLKRVPELIAEGRMMPMGLQAWENRHHSKNYGYTYDGPDRSLGEAEELQFRAIETAWEFFQKQAPSYRKAASFWVMNAKQPETRKKRLETLINDSAEQRKLERATRYAKKPC